MNTTELLAHIRNGLSSNDVSVAVVFFALVLVVFAFLTKTYLR